MNHFFAYMSRLKLIKRWGLMRSTINENTLEHSYQVALIAHSLAVIKNTYFGGNLDQNKIGMMALYHDASEIFTGDLPTPVKYANSNIKNVFHNIEKDAKIRLVNTLPKEMQDEYSILLDVEKQENNSNYNEEVELIHIADKISAYTKCLEELMAGNAEFADAKKTIEETLMTYTNRPEVKYFLENFVPSFTLTLDELGKED